MKKFLRFSPEEEEVKRYERAFTGVLRESLSSSTLKNIFLDEGLFTIKVTSLGPNISILEDLVLGEVDNFVEERKCWWEKWFVSIQPWRPCDVDVDRFAWLCIRGVPCHMWNTNFFKILINNKGTFIKCDESTLAKFSMEEARVCIK